MLINVSAFCWSFVYYLKDGVDLIIQTYVYLFVNLLLRIFYGKLNANNDFNANNITDANFIANTEEVNNIGNIAASQNINWTDGNYQTLTVAANPITLSLTGWGATGKLCKIRLQIATNNVSNVINWNAVGGTVLKGPGFPASFTVSATSNKYAIVDFWTSNAGTTVFADYVGEYSS